MIFLKVQNVKTDSTKWSDGYSLCGPVGADGNGGTVVKNLTASEGHTGDACSIPPLGRSPGEGNGKPLQYSHLGNSKDREAWQARVHGGHKESDMTKPPSPAQHNMQSSQEIC